MSELSEFSNPEGTPSEHRSRLAFWLTVLASFGVGAFLRVRDLRWQIFSDDEWHGLHTSITLSYQEAFSFFKLPASPPLVVYYKLAHDTIGLSEKILRLPMFAFGLLTLLIFPRIIGKRFGYRAACAAAVLLAVSPLLIYYSRYARPYSVGLFFVFFGVMTFFHWWTSREAGHGRVWAYLYAFGAVAGSYFHLTFLPTLLSPLPFAFAELLLRRRLPFKVSQRSWREFFYVSFLVGGGLLVTLGPPLYADWGAIDKRAGVHEVQWKTIEHTLPLVSGTGQWWIVWTMTALAGVGAIRVARKWPIFGLYAIWITLGTVVPTMISKAEAIHVPIVFVRYCLWLLPLFLLLISLAIDWASMKLRSDVAYVALLAAVAAGLYLQGPLPDAFDRANSWTSHAIYQYAYDAESPYSYVQARRPDKIPEFYRQLAEHPPESLVIAEAPWYIEWHNNPLPFYQEVHGQWVKSGLIGRRCRQPRAMRWISKDAPNLHFRNAVDVGKRKALSDHGVDFVILHKDFRDEMPTAVKHQGFVPRHNLPKSRIPRCLKTFRKILGKEVYQDENILVWDVRRFKKTSWVPEQG